MQKIIKKTIKRKKDTDKKSEDFNKKKLTIKQEKFANFYVEKGNATKAAKMAGYSQKSARNVASENLTKPNIRSRIDELAQMALGVIEKLTSDDTVNPSVRMTGAKDILDRAGYKPIEQHEIKGFKNDLSYLSLEDLENLKKTLNGEGNKKSD